MTPGSALTSAPGKLVVAGEYGVLLGFPALVAACSRRVLCRRTPAAQLQFASSDGAAVNVEADPALAGRAFSLLMHVLAAARDRGVAVAPATFTLDSHALYEGQMKLGLGSSAAVAASFAGALIAGADATLDEAARARVLAVASTGHQHQAGGSGIDVAAAVFGGFLRFTRGEPPACNIVAGRVPSDMSAVVVFARSSTQTRDYVQRFLALPPELKTELGQASAAAAAQVEAALVGDDAAALLDGVRAAADAMREIGRAAHIDVVSAKHARLIEIAVQHGGAAKPSGAGGGDVALAFVPKAVRNAFAAAVEGAGLTPLLDVTLGGDGVRTTAAGQ